MSRSVILRAELSVGTEVACVLDVGRQSDYQSLRFSRHLAVIEMLQRLLAGKSEIERQIAAGLPPCVPHLGRSGQMLLADKLSGSGASPQSLPCSGRKQGFPQCALHLGRLGAPYPANSRRISSRRTPTIAKTMMTWLRSIRSRTRIISAARQRCVGSRVIASAERPLSVVVPPLGFGELMSQVSEMCNRSRSAINPGPVGCHRSFLRVCALEAGTSSPTNMASQPK
jgi:hypothetical protein